MKDHSLSPLRYYLLHLVVSILTVLLCDGRVLLHGFGVWPGSVNLLAFLMLFLCIFGIGHGILLINARERFSDREKRTERPRTILFVFGLLSDILILLIHLFPAWVFVMMTDWFTKS